MIMRRHASHHWWHFTGAEWQAHQFWASILTVVGLAWLLVAGPMPVVRGSTAIDADVPLSYMITAFPFLGILLADLAAQLRSPAHRGRGLVLLTQTGFICLLSALRLKYRLPVSGHLLLMAFFLMYSLGCTRSRLRIGETLIGALVFSILLVVKLASWSDWLTPAVALAIAVLVWAWGKLYKPLVRNPDGTGQRRRRKGDSDIAR